MAVAIMRWIGKATGVDVTGETKETTDGSNVIDKIGNSVFGSKVPQDELPQDTGWGYRFNVITQQYEPTENAPEEIKREFMERVKQLTEPAPEIAPPPISPEGFNYTSMVSGARYADSFNIPENNTTPVHSSPLQPTPLQANAWGQPTPSMASPVIESNAAMVHFQTPTPSTSAVSSFAPPPPMPYLNYTQPPSAPIQSSPSIFM